ncbi:unnamed protein product [Plutella xylostella]|uniref:(diamondback moth) hypothetical protein n=1 Tax=Plutella xylostella TaxID=51655 RepID=A0A8S4EGM8_PLUXY|nr:unnamed protein product [Plutella xylostella]
MIKLPTISLPSFDGSYDQWLEFRDTYLSLIHNSIDIDNVQKFHYLRSSLTGNALQVIKSLEFSSDNYVTAWELLQNRYNNNRLLVHNHVKALFSTQSLHKESAPHIRKLIDNVLRNMRALKTLGEPTDSWSTLIIYIIVSKLDSATEREWELYKGTIINSEGDSDIKLSLADLIKFLKDRADVLETINLSQQNKSTQNDNNSKKVTPNVQKSHSYVVTQKNNTKQPLNSSRSKRYSCIMCNANHPLYSCESFLNLSIADRVKYIEDKNICRNCLRAGHAVVDCWFGPCKQCNKKHNSLIHNECVDSGALISSAVLTSQVQPQPEAATAGSQPLQSASHTTHTLYNVNNNTDQVLLSTALIEIADCNNKYHTIRALLDNGSQQCFISEAVCKQLGIPLIQSTVHVTGVGNSVTQSTQSCEVQVRSKTSSYLTRFNCLVLSRITAQLPSIGINHNLQIPEDIPLADPEFHSPGQIDLLIGADKFWDLLNDGLIRLAKGPFLQNTKLGWIISGSINSKHSRINRVHCNFTQTLDAQLKQFWELEEITSCNKLTKDEAACEKLFKETTLRDDTGRFSVRIPLCESADVLGDTFSLAQNRFYALERKLNRCAPEYKQLYVDFMSEYLNLGHMSLIDEYAKPCYFLPHHGVFKESSSTTRLRCVFDASAKSSSGKSLNDIQLIGPALQNDIFSILLRFRQYKYVASADVEKMYRQILIQQDQRDLQLILWRENPFQPLCVYRLNTVSYGTASAPWLSMRCLKQLAAECTDDVISRVINDDFFVDDLVTGHDDKEQLLQICNGVSNVLKSGCFRLRKWIFNSDIQNSQSIFSSKDLSLGDNCQTKTLGMGWFNNSDELNYSTRHVKDITPVTKRTILSIISQIFDPLGLLGPTVIIAKILMQSLWLLKVGWDDPLPTNTLIKWHNFVDKLKYLETIRIPRHIKGDNCLHTDLHIFSDASQAAYAACAYVRTYTDNLPVTVRLLCAKSKVAPVKPVSIPRLELCGALLGARLYAKITESLRLSFNKVHFWTDSTIVLGWLRMSPSLLKTFVQNRVVEINELTGDSQWFHVAGKQNPADMLSRGLALDELQAADMWWSGPEYLRDNNFNPSQENVTINTDNIELPELKLEKTVLVSHTQPEEFPFHRYSSFVRMQRITAYILRFAHNCRSKIKSNHIVGELTVDELDNSTRCLARLSQQQSFPGIATDLTNKRNVKFPRNISSLNIFLDQHNLIRVGGRLGNSESFSYNKKFPVLLCSKHNFTRLLFIHKHLDLLHAGPQLLLAAIRDSWWPLKGRDLARQTVHKCVKCMRLKANTLQIQMGNLPTERLEPGFPFMRCGVDYAGPLFILNRKGRGAKLEKCYICLFVCFATRALHLELVTSLTTEAYILAIKRFISRRGKPLEINSDNGKTFVGALKEFSKFLDSSQGDIINYGVNNHIKFTFIPPYSPHFGGLWEGGSSLASFTYGES